MRRSTKDGIIMDDKAYIKDENPREFPVRIRIIQLLVIILISYNSISIFINTLGLYVDVNVVNISLVLIAAFAFFLFLLAVYDWAKVLGIVSIYIFVLYKSFGQLSNAFYILENNAIERLSSYYEFTPWRYAADYSFAERDMTGLIVMILIPLIILYTLSVLRGIMIRFSYVVAFLPVVATYAIGMVPSEFQLLVFVLSMLYIFKSKRAPKTVEPNRYNTFMHRGRVRSAYVLCVLFLGVYFLLRLLVTPAGHENISKIPEFKSEIQTFMSSFSINDISESFANIGSKSGSSGSRGVGGINHGQLGEVDTVRYRHSDELRISLPDNMTEEGIYLRGFAGSDYTGRSWDVHNEDTDLDYKRLMENIGEREFEPMKQSAQLLENAKILHYFIEGDAVLFNKGKIQIENLSGSSQHMYFPYNADYDSVDESMFLWDLYAFSENDVDQYVVDYYYNISMDIETILKITSGKIVIDYIEESIKSERLYEIFVRNLYTRLPEEGLDRTKKDFSGKNNELGVKNLQEAIDYTKDYLHRRTRYSLSPGKLPSGEDFVEYFIYENQVGYCSHYASAATIMLRAMGYPARYVEGYKVSLDTDYRKIVGKQDILMCISGDEYLSETPEMEIYAKDSNAHAWVEVYVGGFGWVPVEFTPSVSDDIMSGVVDEQLEELTPTPTPTSTPVAPRNIPGDDNHEASNLGEGDKGNPIVRRLIFGSLILLLFIILLISLISGLKSWKYNRYRSLDYNNRAIYIFMEMQKLFYISRDLPRRNRSLEDNFEYIRENCWHIEGESFDDFIETVKKARFSGDTIKKEELLGVKRCYNKLRLAVYQESSLIKKFLMRIGLAI